MAHIRQRKAVGERRFYYRLEGTSGGQRLLGQSKYLLVPRVVGYRNLPKAVEKKAPTQSFLLKFMELLPIPPSAEQFCCNNSPRNFSSSFLTNSQTTLGDHCNVFSTIRDRNTPCPYPSSIVAFTHIQNGPRCRYRPGHDVLLRRRLS